MALISYLFFKNMLIKNIMKKTVSHLIAYLICLLVIVIACSKKKSEDSVLQNL